MLYYELNRILSLCVKFMVLSTLILLLVFLTMTPKNSHAYQEARSVPLAVDCQLEVPSNPTRNLTSLWILEAPCHEGNQNDSVFVQAVLLYPDGTLREYNPLVIDEGTTPVVPPVSIVPPKGTIVGLFGGGNDDSTTLVGNGASSCVNGADGKVFGQVFFCNTISLFKAIRRDMVPIPTLGMDSHNKPCPSVRDFRIVDQDQSDNVQTRYLTLPDGTTMQDTQVNRKAFTNATVLKNGSDNTLISRFVNPVIGCHSWSIPDVTDSGVLQPSQATNELQALYHQKSPIALVPLGDPMTGPNNQELLDAYRSSVDQKLGVHENTQAYCKHMQKIAPPFFEEYKTEFMGSASPMDGTNLYDFLQARFQTSLQILGCKGNN